MPDWMSRERISLMESYGAKVRLVSKEEGGFLGSIQMTEELAKQGNVFLPRQFSNEDNVETHYLTTGEEIVRQLSALGLKSGWNGSRCGNRGHCNGNRKKVEGRKPEL